MKRYPRIQYLELADKDVVYSLPLDSEIQSYTIKTRGNTEFKIAFEDEGSAAGNYLTIPAGCAESEDNLGREAGTTIFVQGTKDNETLEIKSWR